MTTPATQPQGSQKAEEIFSDAAVLLLQQLRAGTLTKPLVVVEFSGYGNEDEVPSFKGIGKTLLAALADLETQMVFFFNEEAALSENPIFMKEASQALKALEEENGEYISQDFSSPEENYKITRLVDLAA